MVTYRRLFIITLVIIVASLGYAVFQGYQYHSRFNRVNLYVQHQPQKTNSSLIQRAILIFYPSSQEAHYLPELRWLYRSWLEMMKDESSYWRTDLLIFTSEYLPSLQQLGCVLHQIRHNQTEPPRCRIFLYLRLSSRKVNAFNQQQIYVEGHDNEWFFQIDRKRSKLLHEHIPKYEYIDSVNIVAEGYPTFSYYHFILKTDIDVFMTKSFANYLPISNSTLLVGQGGYSTDFNTRRLGRIARDLGWMYLNTSNIGSTWYGSPFVAQRIANVTLDAMLFLNDNEFTRVERERKLGVLLWPDWHYGVLSMYGTHLAVNHLLASEKLDIRKADHLLDQSTTNKDQNDLENNNRLHLHCWHTEKPFSKFQFKANKYNSIDPHSLINDRSAQAYAMRMALESRLMTLNALSQHLQAIGNNKTQ